MDPDSVATEVVKPAAFPRDCLLSMDNGSKDGEVSSWSKPNAVDAAVKKIATPTAEASFWSDLKATDADAKTSVKARAHAGEAREEVRRAFQCI